MTPIKRRKTKTLIGENVMAEQKAKQDSIEVLNLAIPKSKLSGKLFGILDIAESGAQVTDFYQFKVSILAEMTLACDSKGKVISVSGLKYVKSFNPSNPMKVE